MKLPKISVVIPSYNKAKYLTKTLESVINQNYPNLEIIIRDGGSTDDSTKIIKRFATKFPTKIYWSSKKDSGQTDAINKGIDYSTGDIVTFLNADDIYNKGALFAVGEAFVKNPKTPWVVGFGNIIGSRGERKFRLISSYKNILTLFNKYCLLLMVNYLTQASVFVRKEAYKKYGPFVAYKKGYVMEYDLWLKLGKIQMPIVINSCLASFRLVRDIASISNQKELIYTDNKIAERHTKNKMILFLHKLNNWGRFLLINRVNL